MNLKAESSNKAIKKQAKAIAKHSGINISHNILLNFLSQLHGYKSWKSALKNEKSNSYILFPTNESDYFKLLANTSSQLSVDKELASSVIACIYNIKDPLLLRLISNGKYQKWHDFLSYFAETNYSEEFNLVFGFHEPICKLTLSINSRSSTETIKKIDGYCLLSVIFEWIKYKTIDNFVSEKIKIHNEIILINGIKYRCNINLYENTIILNLRKLRGL